MIKKNTRNTKETQNLKTYKEKQNAINKITANLSGGQDLHQKGKRTEKNNNNKELSLRLVTYSDVTRSINLKDKGWDVCIKCIGCFVIILTVVPISAFWKCDGCACS